VEGHGRAERDPAACLSTVRGAALAVVATTLLLTSAAVAWRPLRMVARSWLARTAVEGGSMAPTLHAGDWVLVDPDAYERRRPRVGELVLVGDPRGPDRLLVKRVDAVSAEGAIEVIGDARGASIDSRAFGPVDGDAVVGRPFFRYWPPRRLGRVR
jgi:nickel-type superoxide dismutase maturation protease